MVCIVENWRRFVLPVVEIMRARLPLADAYRSAPQDYNEHRVYFLMNDCGIFYVGVTNYLPARLATHAQRFGAQLTHAASVVVPPMFATHIEAIYIHWIRPQANARYVPLRDWQESILSELMDRATCS